MRAWRSNDARPPCAGHFRWMPPALFQRIHACRTDLQVLRSEPAAAADRTDELASDHERYPALRPDHAIERELINEFRALAEVFLEHFGRPAEGGGGACLVLRDRNRGVLRVVHLGKIDEVARRADDGNRHEPVVLL